MARRQPWTPHQEASWPLALMKMLRAGTGGSGVIGWQSSCCKAGQGQPTAPHHPPPHYQHFKGNANFVYVWWDRICD